MPSFERHPSTYIGLAGLMRMIIAGTNMAAYGTQLLSHVAAHPEDANALMDLSTILQIIGSRGNAMARQAQALAQQRLYRLPAPGGPAGIKLLALMGPGDLQVNMPLDFLIEGSDVTLDMLYMEPGRETGVNLAEYDVAIVAAGESGQNRPLLQWIGETIQSWPLPVLNRPDRIILTSRDRVCELLASAPGVFMPVTARIDRVGLGAMAESETGMPIILRPVDSHGGRGLVRIEQAAAIMDYLNTMPEGEFYIAPYLDYRSPDGLFRKYRIVMVEGRFFACHMAVSKHWIIHYVNAGMAGSAEKRAEEAQFMANFDEDFARRHRQALEAIHARMGLDYLVIDCAETSRGELLVFEVDTGGVVHAMDPEDIFPYKRRQMLKIFSAFRSLLGKAANKPIVPLSFGV